MNILQSAKYVLALPPQSINGTDTDGTAIDTLGWKYATVIFLYGASTADMDYLNLKECETSGGTYAAITTPVTSVATVLTSTDDNKMTVWNVQLGGARMRYLKIRVDPGAAATLVGAVAILTRGDQSASTDTERGVFQSLVI